jgi:diguanylate cyclase (GGDEF)-like protein
MTARNPAAVSPIPMRVAGSSPLHSFAAHRRWLWSHAALWQQAVILTLATALGLEAFARLMHLLIPADPGWLVSWRLAGVVAALMLRARRRLWPWIMLGFALNLGWTAYELHSPAAVTAISLTANLLEVFIAAWFLPAFTSLPRWIRTPRITRQFTVFALLLAPASGALVAAGYFAHQNHTSYFQSALFWWLGDALGMVLWLPMILVLTTPEFYALFHRGQLPITLCLLGLLSGLSWTAFMGHYQPIAFIVLPVLLWIGLRLGFAGSVLATNLLALIAIAGTLAERGPFVLMESTPDIRVRALQIFLMTAMLMALPISVVLVEREAFALQLQDAYNKMELQANIDPLTAVANRRRFDETLLQEWQRAIREQRPIALLMVDSDRFKAYNDYYGHQAGDEVLRRIADAMRRVFHRPADLVARYGGEEFCILLPGTDEPGTRHVAEQLRRAVHDEQIVHPTAASGFVTISIGCWSMVPVVNTSPAILVTEADAALYAAKELGRNRVEYGRVSTAASV